MTFVVVEEEAGSTSSAGVQSVRLAAQDIELDAAVAVDLVAGPASLAIAVLVVGDESGAVLVFLKHADLAAVQVVFGVTLGTLVGAGTLFLAVLNGVLSTRGGDTVLPVLVECTGCTFVLVGIELFAVLDSVG